MKSMTYLIILFPPKHQSKKTKNKINHKNCPQPQNRISPREEVQWKRGEGGYDVTKTTPNKTHRRNDRGLAIQHRLSVSTLSIKHNVQGSSAPNLYIPGRNFPSKSVQIEA